MAKKSIEAGEDYDYSISDSMRQYLANQAMESGKGFVGFFDRQRLSSSYGNGSMMMAHEPQHQSKISMSAQPPLLAYLFTHAYQSSTTSIAARSASARGAASARTRWTWWCFIPPNRPA